MDERPLLTTLNDEDRTTALARFRLLQPFLDGDVPLSTLTRERGIALRTAQRWVTQYRHLGLAGLVRKRRHDVGTRRYPDELVRLVEGLALRRPAPSVASVYRQTMVVARERGWPVPSYATVYALIRSLDPGLRTLAHKGAKAYKDRFDLLYRREVDRPNAVWLGDHTPLDIAIRDDHGSAVRPWLTVILDDYSRAVPLPATGLVSSPHPPSKRR
jgi:putative transposase